MRSVTEFPAHKLNLGFAKRAELTAAGKTPEEIQTEMGTAFKMEGDKLKFFLAAIDVAQENQDKLARIIVGQLAEGEATPPKGKQIEEHMYIPDFVKGPGTVNTAAEVIRGGGGKRGDKKGPKESPWGLSPEQKAAKKGSQAKTAASAKSES